VLWASKRSIALAVYGSTHVGVVRDNNEDAFLIAEAGTGAPLLHALQYREDLLTTPLLLAVSDGMGGENAGEIASALTLETVRRALAQGLKDGDVPDALRSAVRQANDAVWAAATGPDRKGMGATLVAAVVDGPRVFFTVVGDSRAYVMRSGELIQVTKDQSALQQFIDCGPATPELVAAFPYKNVILEAVGRVYMPSTPIGRLDLRNGDRLLLCSDGLSSEVTDEEIGTILARVPDPEVACTRLIHAANMNGGHDNITVILVTASGAGLPDAGPEESVLRTFATIPPPPAR
jgi:serine/threonine protein phosphatase PrpC